MKLGRSGSDSLVPAVPPMLVHPSSTPIFTQSSPPAPAPAQPQKEQNIIDLLAKATKQSPAALLAMTRGRGRDRELDRDRGKGRKGAVRTVQAEGKGIQSCLSPTDEQQ